MVVFISPQRPVAGSGLCPTVTVHLLDILFVPHKISQKVLRNGSHPIPHPEPKHLEYLTFFSNYYKTGTTSQTFSSRWRTLLREGERYNPVPATIYGDIFRVCEILVFGIIIFHRSRVVGKNAQASPYLCTFPFACASKLEYNI
jgi:hypothetical protein